MEILVGVGRSCKDFFDFFGEKKPEQTDCWDELGRTEIMARNVRSALRRASVVMVGLQLT
jgi:hypothetical protein